MAANKAGDPKFEQSLVEMQADYMYDPYGWVLTAFPWGEEGDLKEAAPDEWQREQLQQLAAKFIDDPLATIQDATSSGHGIGKGSPCPMPFKRVITSASNSKEAVTMEDVKWGDLKVGDYVLGKDGAPTRIVSTNNYRREHYKVTFDDGSSSVVSGEHEWAVKGRQERRNGIDNWRVMETQEMLEAGVKRPNGAAMARQWEIPACDPVQFKEQPVYDAYTVGVWLGDGCSTTGRIGSSRDEIWAKMGIEPSRTNKRYLKDGFTTATPRRIKAALTLNTMIPVKCDTKFIADEYKYNSESVRRELVSGMLDTDGEVHKSGSIGYSSTSKRLVEDLIWMVRSLGGKAMMQSTPKKAFYVKEGVRSDDCKTCYRCTINFGGSWNPFTHTYKKELLSDKVEPRYAKRWIDSIEPAGLQYGMCITVEAEDHLYLANDFIVTHNSAQVAWIVLWCMSTRPHLAGWVTANTQNQLVKKTWRELAIWHKRCLTGHWFTWTATRFYHKEHPETWGIDAIPWTEHNSEAFAGLHAKYVLIIMDEASAIADKIWEVSEGAMTTPRAMWFTFGNPTRNSGRFRQCFGKFKHRWESRKIDSRTAKMTNKAKIQEWLDDRGFDSDFFRVRVRGEFPVTGSNQLISSLAVEKAAEQTLHPDVYQFQPIRIGCDVARFGDDETVISVIQGRKHVSMESFTQLDNVQVATKCIEVFNRYGQTGVTLFVDEIGVGAGVVDYLTHLGYPVIPVNVGRAAEDKNRFFNARMEIWFRVKEWLEAGADIVDDTELKDQLISPEYEYTPKEQMKLEKKDDMKTRGLSSPDKAESIALCFYKTVQPVMVQNSFEPEDLEAYV